MAEDYVTMMPFNFKGDLKRVVIKLGKRGLLASNQKTLNQATQAIAERD